MKRTNSVFIILITVSVYMAICLSPQTASAKGEILLPLSPAGLITIQKTFADAKDKISPPALSSDGKRIAFSSDNKTLGIWDISRSAVVWEVSDLPDRIYFLSFALNGKYLVSTGKSEMIMIWNASNGRLETAVKADEDIEATAFMQQKGVMATALKNKTIVLWDIGKLKTAPEEKTNKENDDSGIFSWLKKSKSAKKEEAIEQAGLTKLRVVKGKTDNKEDRIEAVALAFSPDGTVLAAAMKEKNVQLWDVANGSLRNTIGGLEREPRVIAFSPDGNKLAIAEDRKKLSIWDITKGAFSSYVESKPVIADNKKKESIWENIKGVKIQTILKVSDEINSLAFSPDGLLLAGSAGKRFMLWDPSNSKEIYQSEKQDKDILNVRFSSDGQSLFTSGDGKGVSVWTLPGIISLAAGKGDARLLALEKERDAKIQALLTPKGEFESTRDYEARKRRNKAEEAHIKKEYEAKIKEISDRRSSDAGKIKKRLYPYSIRGELGSYDADNGSFQARLGESNVAVRVPAERAVELAGRRDKVVFTGMIRYHSQDKVEFVNASLTDSVTGQKYPFGIQVGGVVESEIATSEPVRKSTPAKKRLLPNLEITSVNLMEPSGNGMLDAGENGTIRVTVINRGSGAAESVIVEAGSSTGNIPEGVTIGDRSFVGTLAPGEKKSVEIAVSAAENISSQGLKLRVTALDIDGFDAKPVLLAFETRTMVPPVLQLVKVEINDVDGQRVIKRGKEVTLTLTVRNAGGGQARGVIASIDSTDQNVKLFGDQEAVLNTLQPGETKKAVFTIAVTQRYAGPKTLPIAFSITEERPHFQARPEVRLMLDQEAPDMRVVTVASKETPLPKIEEADDINVAPLLVAGRRAFNANDLAVVVGIERYQSVPKSDYAYNDAKTVKAYLLSLGFAERNIELLTDERATLSSIKKSVETWLPNRVKKGSRVFFYYSGHGAPEPATGDAYIVPYDGDPSYLSDTGYSVKRLYEKLGAIKAAEVIVVIDSCFSGSGGRSVIAKGARPLVMVPEGEVIPPHMAVLSSTQGSQISTSFAEKEHGVFTYYFLKALKEGKRNIDDIYQFVKPEVEDTAKGRNVNQTPNLQVGSKNGSERFLLLK